MKTFRVMVTGGGSGGHIYPIIAVVSELQLEAAKSDIDLRVRYVGACGQYGSVLDENNIKVKRVAISKIRRYASPLNALEIPKFVWSFLQALWWTYWFMPDILFSKGGPGSLPVVFAAKFYMIPVVIHESDSVPGVSNLFASKFAKHVILAFQSAAQYFPSKKVAVLGNPIREALLRDPGFDQEQLKRRYGFDIARPLLFVYGGSLGSQRINDFVVKNLPLILQVVQIFHQTGKENYPDVLKEATAVLNEAPEEMRGGYKIVDFLLKDEQVREAYSMCDLVLSRGGASNIFEIAAFKKPSIIVPLPESAQNHQAKNAYEYAASGASIVIEEPNLLPNLFLDNLISIVSSAERRGAMSSAAGRFYKQRAASNIAKLVLSFSR